MSRDPFSSPSGDSKITDFEGNLLLVTPTDYLTGVTTAFGDKDCVEAEVVVLDGEDGAEVYDGVRIFQGVLISELKPKVGKGMVLGRLGRREPKQKGHQGAWALMTPTDEDKELAREFIAERADSDPFAEVTA